MANTRTIARIEARIRERAAEILLREISDPRATFITVVRVEMKSDLLSGKIFYSVYGTEADRSKVAHMLKGAAGFLQRQIAPALKLRRMPHLTWVYDDSVAEASNMDRLIAEARERDTEIRQIETDEVESDES